MPCEKCKELYELEYLNFSEDGKKLICPSCFLDEEYKDEPVYRSFISEYDSDGF